MPARLKYTRKVVLGCTRKVDLCSLRQLGVWVGQVVTIMKTNIVITVNHNAATINVERLIVPHASMSGEVILEANEDALAQFPLEYRCTSSNLAIAQLMGSSARSTALATAALASLVELLKYI